MGGIHVQAMEGTSGEIKYYGHIKNSYTTVDAGITTKTTRYPTAKAIVYWGKMDRQVKQELLMQHIVL